MAQRIHIAVVHGEFAGNWVGSFMLVGAAAFAVVGMVVAGRYDWVIVGRFLVLCWAWTTAIATSLNGES
ncbi:MAG TPA: hypothetical protein DCP11_15840 [Microbacteriaceae bacterium]|jgi:hypothetical protein|nr:hypothetical protein [Microbacteriaceae bacterium]